MLSSDSQSASVGAGTARGGLRHIWAHIDVHSTAILMSLAVGVGVGTALVAVLFIKAISVVTSFSFEQGMPQFLAFLGPAWIVLVPIIGGLIGGPIIARWAIEAKGHGVPEVLQAIILRGGRIRPRVALVKSIASTICIGTGGSAGREGPIVQVGAALGSTAAQLMKLGTERTITLVACGAAAGIAATFNAPIAGVVFAMEVILGEFTTQYFGTVVVAAVSASIVSRQFLGSNPAFTVPTYSLVSPGEIPFYAILGVLAALAGWAFVGILYFFEDRFDAWRLPAAWKPAVGAIGVGLTALLYPQALGTGLASIGQALQGALPWTLLLALVFAKLAATSFTLGSGNSGGIFSPSLFMGAMLGGAFGYWVHILFPAFTGSMGAYALVGMAAVFAASAHAPLTAFLIVFEMSGDYRMILPLMVTVGLSTLISQRMRRYSIYTWKLAKRDIPLERDRDVDIIRGLNVGEVMTFEPDVIDGQASLQELSDAMARTGHHGFPVIDPQPVSSRRGDARRSEICHCAGAGPGSHRRRYHPPRHRNGLPAGSSLESFDGDERAGAGAGYRWSIHRIAPGWSACCGVKMSYGPIATPSCARSNQNTGERAYRWPISPIPNCSSCSFRRAWPPSGCAYGTCICRHRP